MLYFVQFGIAGRLNLTDLQVNANSSRYLTFIKGRVGRKISDFFMDFLGAGRRIKSTGSKSVFIAEAVSDYCDQGRLSKEQAQKR